jgi:hypothetical protein
MFVFDISIHTSHVTYGRLMESVMEKNTRKLYKIDSVEIFKLLHFVGEPEE